MPSPLHLISHSAPKAKKTPTQQKYNKKDCKAQPNRNKVCVPPYVSHWIHVFQKICSKPDFHIHALNNSLSSVKLGVFKRHSTMTPLLPRIRTNME